MKKLLFIIGILSVTISYSHAQYADFGNQRRSLSYQVVTGIMNYDGAKYGWGLGGNYKGIISLNYFHYRDYKFEYSESFADKKYGGIHFSMVLPVSEKIEIGGGLRHGTLNSVWQKPVIKGEARIKFNDTVRLAFEYGRSRGRTVSSVRFLFNLY